MSAYQTWDVRGIPVFRTIARGDHLTIHDLEVDVSLALADGAVPGDDGLVQRGVYGLAAAHAAGEAEDYALAIARYLRPRVPDAVGVTVDVSVRGWQRLTVGDRPRGGDFTGPAREERVARAEFFDAERMSAGLRRLPLLAVSGGADARAVMLVLSANWTYGWSDVPFSTQWQQVRRVLTEAWAERARDVAPGEQARALAAAVLDEAPAINSVEVRLERCPLERIDADAVGLDHDDGVFGAPVAARTVHLASLVRTEFT